MTDQTRVLLYGDVNCNIIDGSSIWLQSVAEVLSRAGARVTVLLKSEVRNRRIVDALQALPGVDLLDHWAVAGSGNAPVEGERTLSPRRAAQVLVQVTADRDVDVILCRGLAVCAYLVTNARAAERLWAYVTDIPRQEDTSAEGARLATVAERARYLFAQTEDARSHLEAVVPAACGKTLLLTPMVPDHLFDHKVPAAPFEPGAPLRLVYAGKFAKDWRTLEMAHLPAALQERGQVAELTMIGDKVQGDRSDSTWADRMREAVRARHGAPAVRWAGGVPRADALEMVRTHHLGLGWRTPALDDSLELSTKLLEYAAVGVPPVVNRTQAHEALLGADYPFFIDGSVVDAVASAALPGVHALAAERAREAVRPYGFAASAARMRTYLDRYVPHVHDASARPLRVVLAGHDLKFASDLLDALLIRPDLFEVRVDLWDSLHRHDESRSRDLVAWADVVFCEWAGPNSVWYAGHKRHGQRLLIRFHGFEIRGPWIRGLDTSAVDEIVFVSEHYRRHAVEELGWADVATRTISNSVDSVDLARPKLSGAEWHLGMVGAVPMLKRPDRALDTLERLLQHDDRFVLHLKSRAPWDYPWEWTKMAQRDSYEALLERIERRALIDHVVLEEFSPDMASWYRKVGWIVSPSTRETFHLAALEGMASGCVPLVWARAGAAGIFGERWIVEDSASAARRVCEGLDGDSHKAWSDAAKESARRYDLARLRPWWWSVVAGDVVPALGTAPALSRGAPS